MAISDNTRLWAIAILKEKLDSETERSIRLERESKRDYGQRLTSELSDSIADNNRIREKTQSALLELEGVV
ncbi:MAG: hypothetical protein GY799_12350 [Desulfobulbaceae bacterium]|nr:hypothetical protein [Desulfobulbaceae bacterium]